MVVKNIVIDISNIIFNDDVKNYHLRYVKNVIFSGHVRNHHHDQ